MLSIIYAQCHLCWLSQISLFSVVMLNVIMLIVVAPFPRPSGGWIRTLELVIMGQLVYQQCWPVKRELVGPKVVAEVDIFSNYSSPSLVFPCLSLPWPWPSLALALSLAFPVLSLPCP